MHRLYSKTSKVKGYVNNWCVGVHNPEFLLMHLSEQLELIDNH